MLSLSFLLYPDPVTHLNATPAVLVAIADCESGDGTPGSARQFDDQGYALRGRVNHHDVGEYQINEGYHSAAAKHLGYDIYTEEGNISYALYLYKTQGTSPWNASRHCWGGNSPPNQQLATDL